MMIIKYLAYQYKSQVISNLCLDNQSVQATLQNDGCGLLYKVIICTALRMEFLRILLCEHDTQPYMMCS